VSGHNRGFEDERRLIEEQLQDVETEEERRLRLEREAAERAAGEQRQRERQERIERLCQEAVARTPPECHALVRRFLTEDECPAPADDWPPAVHNELQRFGFLRALVRNEDDTTTRLVYADWLDERGEHEEADRQRRWPVAHEWLVRFCKENSDYREASYNGLIEFGRQVTREGNSAERVSERVYLDSWGVWNALADCSQEFWKHWSVITGVPLPPSMDQKGFHSWMCCSHEVYYWFGPPDRSETEDVLVETDADSAVDAYETDDTANLADPHEATDVNLPDEKPEAGDADEPSASPDLGGAQNSSEPNGTSNSTETAE
jgi:uncharacterized protein (TIGR02996 family)